MKTFVQTVAIVTLIVYIQHAFRIRNQHVGINGYWIKVYFLKIIIFGTAWDKAHISLVYDLYLNSYRKKKRDKAKELTASITIVLKGEMVYVNKFIESLTCSWIKLSKSI